MRPALAGAWKPAALDGVELAHAVSKAYGDLGSLRIYERSDGALAFVNLAGEVEHLVWHGPAGGLICICPPEDREATGACSAMAFVALDDIGYTPRPSQEG